MNREKVKHVDSEVWLSDMSKCLPEDALSRRRRKYHWQLIEYEAEGGLKGVMLSASPETEAPNVILDPELSGWHAIYVGIWGISLRLGIYTDDMVKVRLKSDPCFTSFTRESKHRVRTIEEGFWKYADLTGEHLIIGQQRSGFTSSANLAYIRLVPLSAEEVSKIQQDRARRTTKRLIAANDAFSDLFLRRPTTKEDLLEMIEPYKNTDFKKIFWEIGYGRTSLGSKTGILFGERCEDFPRVGDRYVAESLQILTSKGIDPLKIAIDHAHSIGLELHVSQRIEAFQSPPPWEECNTTEFYKQHPEFRLVDRNGTEITGLSYAYPEVRDYYISVLKEAAEYGADGAVVIFLRAPPMILYEQPLVDGFKKEYGIDPRRVDERDKEWLRYRAGFITLFMKQIRQAMDEVGEDLGKRLETSAITLPTFEENLLYGLDIEAWLKESLVDNLIPYSCRPLLQRTYDGQPPKTIEIDMNFYSSITKGYRCKVYPNVMPRRMPPREFRSKALDYYKAGADGLFFWDTNSRHDTTSIWSTVRRLGHIDELKAWAKKEICEKEPKTINLLKLSGHAMLKYSPYRGG